MATATDRKMLFPRICKSNYIDWWKTVMTLHFVWTSIILTSSKVNWTDGYVGHTFSESLKVVSRVPIQINFWQTKLDQTKTHRGICERYYHVGYKISTWLPQLVNGTEKQSAVDSKKATFILTHNKFNPINKITSHNKNMTASQSEN